MTAVRVTSMRKGDQLTLTIERPTTSGRMITRYEGAVVLVTGAIPDESVEAEVEKVTGGAKIPGLV